MGKIHNFILKSTVGTGGANYGKTYYIDWGRLPQGKYKVSFAFTSAVVATVNATVANLFVDLGQGSNTFIAQNPSASSSYRHNYLGFLLQTGTGAGNSLYSDAFTNPPVYIDQIPTSNSVFVEIHKNTSPFEANYDAPDVGQYTLILSFENQN